MYDWLLTHLPLLVRLPEGDVDLTLAIMACTFFGSIVILAMNLNMASTYYTTFDRNVYIAGFMLLGVGVASALVGAPIILIIGKWVLITVAIAFSIRTIYRAVKDFAAKSSFKKPRWMTKKSSSSSESSTQW